MTTKANPTKRKPLMTIIYALGAILAIFVVIVAMRPDDFRIMRSLAITAPASIIFPQVNNLHNFNAWSP